MSRPSVSLCVASLPLIYWFVACSFVGSFHRHPLFVFVASWFTYDGSWYVFVGLLLRGPLLVCGHLLGVLMRHNPLFFVLLSVPFIL